MQFDLKTSQVVFRKSVEDLCAPNPVPVSLNGLKIDITDYPKMMQEIIGMVGSDVNAELASEMSLKCHIYASYIGELLTRLEVWGGVLRKQREDLFSDLTNNTNNMCPGVVGEKSEAGKGRVASLNPQYRILVGDRQTAKVVIEDFQRKYDGLVRAHYMFKAIVERETQARKSQPNDNLPNFGIEQPQ